MKERNWWKCVLSRPRMALGLRRPLQLGRGGGRERVKREGGERGVASKSGCVAKRTRGGREGERGALIMPTVTRFFLKTEQLEINATNRYNEKSVL